MVEPYRWKVALEQPQVVAEVNGWSTANKGNVDIWQSYADRNQVWHDDFG
jgi:hypothetical protein